MKVTNTCNILLKLWLEKPLSKKLDSLIKIIIHIKLQSALSLLRYIQFLTWNDSHQNFKIQVLSDVEVL